MFFAAAEAMGSFVAVELILSQNRRFFAAANVHFVATTLLFAATQFAAPALQLWLRLPMIETGRFLPAQNGSREFETLGIAFSLPGRKKKVAGG